MGNQPKESRMFTHQSAAALAGAVLLALPLQALPNTDRSHDWHDRADRGPEKRLVEKYDRFAGSDENARELVNGLRNDQQIELSKGGKTTKFTPATGKMGWGNVDNALALAKASLAERGIRNPTPEQIKAALNGGTITTKSGQRLSLPGVLKLRANGMGWGEIAHKLGFKLGDVKRAHKDDKRHHKHADRHDHRKHADWKPERRPDAKHHGRPEFHRAKFERPQRPERPERHHRGR
jgi:hypothetical protein